MPVTPVANSAGHPILISKQRPSARHPNGTNMKKLNVKGQRLAALFLLGIALFNYPLLALFNRPDTIWGIPVLYAYVFGAWALFVALLALVVEKT